MLEAKKGKVCKIINVVQKNNALIIKTENGTIKLEIIDHNIIRVVYTLEKDFSQRRSLGLTDNEEHRKNIKEDAPISWSYREVEDEIVVETKQITLRISSNNGAFRYYDKKQVLLLKEPDKGGKYLIPFDSFKTLPNEDGKVKRIITPDGVKEIIEEGNKEYDKVLYHSRQLFEWQENEGLYGLGQQEEGHLNLRGTRQYIHQANMKIAMPLVISTKGYGILFDTYSPIIFNDNAYGSYIYNEACEVLDYYFIKGKVLDDVIKGYRTLTGKATMLPKWAFGFMQSMERYESQEEILETVNRFQKNQIPLDCLVLDWQSWEEGMWGQKTFDPIRFPNPGEMIQSLHQKGIHFMISIWPNMVRDSENYKEMVEVGGTLQQSEIYNAFDEKSRDLYFKQANEGLFAHGVDAWWCDSSEPFTPEWNHLIKPEPDQNYLEFHKTAAIYFDECLTNTYPLMHAKTMYEGQRQVSNEKRVVNLTRSGYTGIQRYGTILWSGDISANWDTLKKQIPAGLNLCASGLPYWTFDIGAFFVKQGELWFWNGDYEKGCDDLGYRELYTRFYQMGTFLPIHRSHGTDTRREIWNFGEKGTMFYDSIEAFTHLRYKLMPYIYSMAGQVFLNDFTMLRLLAFDFSQDILVHDIRDQFMFGKALMVCPITEPMYYDKDSVSLEGIAKSREVYLPKSSGWYDFWTHEYLDGNQTIKAPAPIDRMPIYVKAGSIIPEGNPCQNTSECDETEINLKVFPGEDNTFTLYQDENDNYHYEEGKHALIEFLWEDTNYTLVIKERIGTYVTMPKSIRIHIDLIGKSQKTVVYTGDRLAIEL